MSAKDSGNKVGRGNSKKWIASGGPIRMAKRKAINHGCALWQMHMAPADRKHSGAPATA